MFKFSDIAIGQHFISNGTEWIKKSSRTAWILNKTTCFYFGLSETVNLPK